MAGIFTHFADAGDDPAFTITQHTRFLEAVEVLRPVAPDALLHTSGSAAILAHPAMHHDLVRVGHRLLRLPAGARARRRSARR